MKADLINHQSLFSLHLIHVYAQLSLVESAARPLPSRPLLAHADLLLEVAALGAQIPILASKTCCGSRAIIELNMMTILGRRIKWGEGSLLSRQRDLTRSLEWLPSHMLVAQTSGLSR